MVRDVRAATGAGCGFCFFFCESEKIERHPFTATHWVTPIQQYEVHSLSEIICMVVPFESYYIRLHYIIGEDPPRKEYITHLWRSGTSHFADPPF